MASNTPLLVAAIDFGTTYSGWAFSFKHEYDSDPTKISGKHYYGGPLVSMKAPTTVLIKPDGRTFDSFGYEAEDKYIELAGKGDHENWYYFRRFKMMLHEKIGLTRVIKLEDETHKQLSAKTVFSLAIRYLKDEMLKTRRDRLTREQLKDDEIAWVLTVPAIWNDPAKQFMREAAVEAGIKNEKLQIALEPETASIFCRLLPVEQMVDGSDIKCFRAGSKYMVLDAGGGTVDITVHEVMPGGKLKELHKASGGAWGGTQVDEAYKQFIISLVGIQVFQRFCKDSKEDQIDIFRDFEIKKRGIAPDKEADVTIRLPSTLKDIFEDETGEDLRKVIKQARYASDLTLVGDKLRVKASVMKSFFSNAINSITSHVKELLNDSRVQGISSILMVGGFSESKMLQHAIKSSFPNVSVLVPRDAGLVVLQGAVVFGHNPSLIVQRVCKYTYGVANFVKFNEKIHDIKKRRIFDDGPYCADVFDKYVEIGQIVTLNQSTIPKTYIPTTEADDSFGIRIYASSKKSPMYVTEDGCVKLGYVNVYIRDKSIPLEERDFLVTMEFGGTEIQVTAIEKRTGNSTTVEVRFLG